MKRSIAAAVLLLLIGAGAYCGYRYYQEDMLPEKQLDEAYDAQTALFARVRPEPVSPSGGDAQTAQPAENPAEENPLLPAEAVNDSVVAWLTIPGTHIDYPVCQAEDNDFYLHNGFDGQYNYGLGCPFLDYRCESDFSGFNSIVYAHNMDQQRMFADIALYKDSAFMESHPTGTLILRDGAHTVRFFAYLTVPSRAPAYHAVFVSQAEKDEYLDYIFTAARYTMGLSPDDSDADDLHLLLLSTCTFETEDTRGILVGEVRANN